MAELSDHGTVRFVSGVTVTVVTGSADVRPPGAHTQRGLGGEDPFVLRLRELDERIEIVDSFDIGGPPGQRDGGGPAAVAVAVDVPVSQAALVLLLDEATGLWRWQAPDDSVAGTGKRFTVDLPEPSGVTSRGLAGAIAGRVVKVVVLKLGGKLLKEGGLKLAELFERHYRRGGLRWFTPENYAEPKPEPDEQLSGADVARLTGGRSLLFLHGPFALAHSGFRRLPAYLLERLTATYEGRVWAYDHSTLSRTPAQNAADLLARLEELGNPELEVDIIAHSRGGLVARELVARADRSPVKVRSVIFAATPNAGTPLCDPGHLPRLVDRVTNLLALVPDNPLTDVIDAVATVAASMAETAAGGLVGLTAMDPKGAYLTELNARRPMAGVTYRALVSDYQPAGDADLLRKIRNLVADRLLARQGNDLLVPTASAYDIGGKTPLVAAGDVYEFGPHQAVDHFGFWDQPELEECLERWFELKPRRRQRDVRPPAPDPRGGRTPGAAAQTVTVRAVHASLEHAVHPVIVGHFLGTPLEGAEVFLDKRLGGRLSGRHRLGLYPERVGQSMVVDSPNATGGGRRGYPPGGVVVGLDAPGELTREKLSATVTAALVQQAATVLERRLADTQPGAGPEVLRFAAVPVGTAAVGAMSVESCVAALVDGVIAANDQLYRHTDPASGKRAWDQVRIGELEIVELWADRAELVAHAVRRVPELLQVDPTEHTLVEAGRRLVRREGALPSRPPAEDHAGAWQRIIIRDPRRENDLGRSPEPRDGVTVLEFTAVGRRARADRMLVTIDSAAVESLVASAIEESEPGSHVGNTLYELLLPTALKGDLPRVENVQLIVDEHTADFPWEALTTRLGGARERELAVRGGFLRQFRETEGARPDVRTPTGRNVLVIGNPPAGAGFAQLPGARQEAAAVAQHFRTSGRRYAVTDLIWDGQERVGDPAPPPAEPGRLVLDTLFQEEWSIVHIASHGRFDPDDSSRSGAVIDEDVCVTANVVRQLPVVPQLVFLNCCHLGRVAGSLTGPSDANRLAASVARELMRIGVSAVMAAGWAVDDRAAVLFARSFYEELLAGELLGDAVHTARRKVRQEFPTSMTWAAFQCYGDPGYQLVTARSSRRIEHVFVSDAELIRRIQTVRVLAGKIGVPDFDDIAEAEGRLVDELKSHRGSDNPEVLYELGSAFGELGRYADAVGCYRRAWQAPRSNVLPVQLLEQLGNFEVRLAQRLHRSPATDDALGALVAVGDDELTVGDLLRDAGEHLALALQLGPTGERLALLGSFHKKAATMGGDRQQELESASRHYEAAHRSWLKRNLQGTSRGRWRSELKPYYALLWLQTAALAGRPVDKTMAHTVLDVIATTPAAPEVDVDSEGEVIGSPDDGPAPSISEDEEDYWVRVTLADVALTRRLLFGSPDVSWLEKEYRAAFATRSSRRDRDSTIDHIRDVAQLTLDAELQGLADRLDGNGAAPARRDGAKAVATPAVDRPSISRREPSPSAGLMTIEMMPAAHGDCLLVIYGQKPRRILIDGGPAHRYGALRRRLAQLPAGERRIDLLVVTHVDSDHIDGAVVLLQDRERFGLEIDDIWFNGAPQLWPQPATRGPVQGEFLGALIPPGNWNKTFDGHPVVLGGGDGALPAVTLPDGAVLTFLSPGRGELDRLRSGWEKAVADAGFVPGDTEASLKLLADRKALQPGARGEKAYGGDNAAANGSSIAFLFEHGGHSCLFTGDAYAPVLKNSLARLSAERGVERITVDVMKLPHHGSMSNVTAELFSVLDCRRFLISTNGAIFDHPDPQTLELLAEVVGDCEVVFNYRNEVVTRWEEELEARQRRVIDPVYPAEEESPTVVEVT